MIQIQFRIQYSDNTMQIEYDLFSREDVTKEEKYLAKILQKVQHESMILFAKEQNCKLETNIIE